MCVKHIQTRFFFVCVCLQIHVRTHTCIQTDMHTNVCVFVLAGMIYIFMDLYICISNLLVVREAVNAASKSECLHLLPQTHQYPAR